MINTGPSADAIVLPVGRHRLEATWTNAAQGQGPTLVLLHEALGCVGRWKTFPRLLAQATGAKVFAWSRPGHGRSSPGESPRPLDYLEREGTDGLPAVLHAAGIDACVLVGHSDGATIAALNAALAPVPGLRATVLIAPHFFVEEEGLNGIRHMQRLYRETDLRRRLAAYHGDNTDAVFSGWADTWLSPGFRAWEMRGVLSRISVPTLLVQGGNDEYATLEQFAVARRVMTCHLEEEVMPGIGHSPHLEVPERLAQRIATFLAPLWPHPMPSHA